LEIPEDTEENIQETEIRNEEDFNVENLPENENIRKIYRRASLRQFGDDRLSGISSFHLQKKTFGAKLWPQL